MGDKQIKGSQECGVGCRAWHVSETWAWVRSTGGVEAGPEESARIVELRFEL